MNLRDFAFCLLTTMLFAFGEVFAQSKPLPVPFPFPEMQAPVFRKETFDIRKYGAKEGGVTLNSDAIRKAIVACNAAGGGSVMVPKGIWLTGAIHLKSNVNLHLVEGAELRFSQKFDDYLPVVLIQRGGFFCYNYSPFVYAKDCENIAVTGKGTLNGQGQVWWPWKDKQPGMTQLFQMGKSGVPIEQRVFGTEKAGVRPPFIQFLECKNILMEDITIVDGPSWNVHPVFSENIIIRKIKIRAHGPNNDGIDPDGCKNVLIEDCGIDVGDDNICLKSGRDEEAWKIGRPCENIVVRRCSTKAGHGGLVIGSEMSAGVKNVLVEDCHFAGTDRGLRFKSRVGRGGIVENVWARNITMKNIKGEAIVFDLTYDSEPIEKNMNYGSGSASLANAPVFRNFHIENIQCDGAKRAISLRGLPGKYLHDITFDNIRINSENGVFASYSQFIKFRKMEIKHQKGDAFQLENCSSIQY
ncbi:glycoside hydrolase family 28 protein [Dyadobacter sp. CY323]|uniref:glycoside hydrolase family 28 protein n=1 Tax=Dyadobacter sp. CY323 TaxID=2907302 RepID=UPI001F26D227|nr:glycoside hydrolase family 28 protein [Dyadobacter sp. CY323]MCE6991212.1 glycoside hydrolase family 28 protein [Dyadobacter sp. CY323]